MSACRSHTFLVCEIKMVSKYFENLHSTHATMCSLSHTQTMEEKLQKLWLQAFPKLWQNFSSSRLNSGFSEATLQDDLALTTILYQMMAFGLSEHLAIQQSRIHHLESTEKPRSQTRSSENAGISRKPLSPSSKININAQGNAIPEHLTATICSSEPPKALVSSAREIVGYRTPPKAFSSSRATPNHLITPSPEEYTSPSMFSVSCEDTYPSSPSKENIIPSANSTLNNQAQAGSPIIGKSRKSSKNDDLDMTTWDGSASEPAQLSMNPSPVQRKQITKSNAGRSLSRKARSSQPDAKQRTLYDLKKVTPRAVQRDVSLSGEFSGGFRIPRPRSPKKKTKTNVAVNLLQKMNQCDFATSRTSEAKTGSTESSEQTLLEDNDYVFNVVSQMRCLETQQDFEVSTSPLRRVSDFVDASDPSQRAAPSGQSTSAVFNIPDEELDIDEDVAETEILASQAINPAVEVKMEVDETTVVGANPPYTQVKTSQRLGSQADKPEKDFSNNTMQLAAKFNGPTSTTTYDAISFHEPKTKLEKLILLGQICTLCKKYYDDIRFLTMSTQQIDKVMNTCSRHAARKKPVEPLQSTPPDFWVTGMPSTLECIERGMIHVEPEKYKAKSKPPPKYRMD